MAVFSVYLDIYELLDARVITITHETVRQRCLKFGQDFANVIRRRPSAGVDRVQGKRENNRAEVSHQPVQQRERHMRRFKSHWHAQMFLSAHGPIINLFRIGRHLLKATHYRELRDRSFTMWNEVSYVQNAT